MAKKIIVVLYGPDYWKKVVNFEAMVDSGVIAREDMNLFCMCDKPEDAFEYLRAGLTKYHLYMPPTGRAARAPEIARTRP